MSHRQAGMDRKRGKKRGDQAERCEWKAIGKLDSNEERGEEIFTVMAKSMPCNSLVNIERHKEKI